MELYNKRGVAVIMSFSPPTKADTMDKFTKHILILIFLSLNGMLVDGMLIDHTYKSNRFRRFISPMLTI